MAKGAKGADSIVGMRAALQARKKFLNRVERNPLAEENQKYLIEAGGTIRHETPMDRVTSLGKHQHYNSAQEAAAAVSKRRPIMLDYVLEGMRQRRTHLPTIAKKSLPNFLDMMMNIKKFVLDDQAARYLGEYMRDHPDKIARANEYAIPPFKTMWVEYSVREVYEALHGFPLDDRGDTRMGLLVNGPDVMMFVEGPKEGDCQMSPFMARLNKPATLEEELELCRLMGISRINIDSLMWGTPGVRIRKEFPELYPVLRANHAFIAATDLSGIGDGHLRSFFEDGTGGDLRNVVALMIFLNRTQDVQVMEERKAKPGLIMRKPRAYIGHSVITLKINPVERLRRIGEPSGISSPKRLHDVRGHYCRNKLTKQAEEIGDTCEALDRTDPLFYLTCHDWKEVEGSKHVDQKTGAIMTWKCSRCKGVLWRKPEHKRGTLKQGYVVQQYAVTTK